MTGTRRFMSESELRTQFPSKTLRAAYLVVASVIPMKIAAEIGIGTIQRAVKAIIAGRGVGINGRPRSF